MRNENSNPLLAVRQKTKIEQSNEPAPEPVAPPILDTTTPALTKLTPRRFDLNELPRYADKMFPVLQSRFPHLNNRMYGGWLRSCINDNASHFTCVDGAVSLAQIMHDPLNPQPFVEVVFNIGHEEGMLALAEDVFKWARSINAPEVRCAPSSIIKKIKGHREMEERKVIVFHM